MNTFKSLLLVVVLALAVSPAFAQTATTTTILTEALAAGAQNQTLTVASTTGMTAGNFVFIDREQMRIQTVISSTQLRVARGSNGVVAGHLDNALVLYGTTGTYNPNTGNAKGVFIAVDPSGSCTSTTSEFLPVVNVTNGNIWNCTSVNSIVTNSQNGTYGTAVSAYQYWVAVNLNGSSNAMPTVPYRTVTDAAYTATLSDYFIDVNSITAGRTITLPAVTGIYGNVKVVKHSGATAAITIAAPSGQYVGTLGTASTTISSGQSIRLISVGGGWATFGLD